ncbi:hypothetical protein EX30DRAFT_343613 [Ascodesmis nigricans]|uniref:Uncharacterized protein n=1 Tax=Ascodesmis nigricans TaxID=341454 RepID=A0A4S2MLV5_9PEZI|nr:hypothetical protein EX30DRAFT_343613 [Ascodesmis nigricans]
MIKQRGLPVNDAKRPPVRAHRWPTTDYVQFSDDDLKRGSCWSVPQVILSLALFLLYVYT